MYARVRGTWRSAVRLHDISGGHARHAASRGYLRQVFTYAHGR
jgi:hypothetical protein